MFINVKRLVTIQIFGNVPHGPQYTHPQQYLDPQVGSVSLANDNIKHPQPHLYNRPIPGPSVATPYICSYPKLIMLEFGLI